MLFSQKDSKSIDARLLELKGQLLAADADVELRQEALEIALAEGKPSEKPLDELGKARARVAALGSVISKGERELKAALAHEERVRERAGLTALEKNAAAAMEVIRSTREKLLGAARGWGTPVAAFDQALGRMKQLAVGSGLNLVDVGIPTRGAPIAGKIGQGLELDALVNGEAARFETISQGLLLAIACRLEELDAEEAVETK